MLTFALLALLMAACSEDNALESSPTEGVEETVPVTFTAAVKGDYVMTRVPRFDRDDNISECVLVAFDSNGTVVAFAHETGISNNNIPAMTLNLPATGTFAIRCFAYYHESIRPLFSYTNGNSYITIETINRPTYGYIAYMGQPEKDYVMGRNDNDTEIRLTHAVAKVTLKSTTYCSSSSPLTIRVPETYSSKYELFDTDLNNSAAYNYFITLISSDTPGEIFSFYVFCEEDKQDIEIYKRSSASGEPDFIIEDVPLAPNKHIILEGDVANIGTSTNALSRSAADGFKVTVEDLKDNGEHATDTP